MGLPFKTHFPKKGYFVPLFETFRNSPRLLIPKTRDMVTSWSALVWATHQAQWRSAFAIVQSMKDTKAQELIEYAAILYREQPEFLKARHPLDGQTKNEIRWADGGRIMGVPAGENQIRTFHPTIWICDEIAFIPEAEECWNAVHAAGTPQMIGISSAGPGWMAEQCQSRVTPEAAPVVMRPRPEPVPEPEPQPEKTLEEKLEEERQRILNPIDPALELFVQRRDEEQARRSSREHP